MAKIDKKYRKLLEKILKKGSRYEDPNRKDVYRIQIPSYTFKHDFKDGFPAITTKKLYWKGIVGELLWILRGDTNIKYLVDNGINIWNKDAFNRYCERYNITPYTSKVDGFFTFEEFVQTIKNKTKKHPVIGDLGRVYGAQWRNWTNWKAGIYKFNNEHVDQISNLIKGLKENPMGTKHIVTAWNPAELDDMALPPCHWSFEILVEPIEFDYVADYTGLKENDWFEKACKNLEHNDIIKCENKYYQIFFGPEHDSCEEFIPKHQFTLKWHQRSVDTFLGLPFNIASYALLAQIIGKMTNMVPKGIIGDLSNVHIYEPHLDSVKEQLSRNVNKYNHCELHFAGEESNQGLEKGLTSNIDNLTIRNFKLRNYNSYPAIKEEMLAYNK